MDYLQYQIVRKSSGKEDSSFKPYYKWITFNIPPPIWDASELSEF